MFDRLVDGIPAAPGTGLFPFAPYLDVLWTHTSGPEDSAEVVSDAGGAMAVWRRSDRVEFVGPENLVDYRSPLGDPSGAFSDWLKALPAGTNYRFDSLPSEAADVVAAGLDGAGLAAERHQHESAAVLDLPTTYDDYMTAIGKKERHETRRKIRRFIANRGEPRIVTYTEPGPVLNRFFSLHRLADGDKSAFMTPAMTRLFNDLVALDGWQVDALYGDGPRAIAAAVSCIDDEGYYLYNSAYDPDARDSSPGVVMLASLIERSIEMGHNRFDFLKGDEGYKYRLGAVARPLYAFEGRT